MSPKKKDRLKPISPKEKSSAASPLGDKKLIRRLAILLFVFAFLLYSNTLKHHYVLDDYSVIKENALTQKGFSGLKDIFSSSYREGYGNNESNLYRPLSKAMFAIEWQLAPDQPALGHFINVLLYAFECALLFFVLIKTTRLNTWLLFIAALLFTAHPIHTEVVANIKSRDEIMSMIFLLLSLYLAHSYAINKKILRFAGSLVCFFLALLSKESAIIFVALIPLTIFFFSTVSMKNNVIITAATGAIAGIYLLIHHKVIGSIGIPIIPVIDNSLMITSDFFERKFTEIYILGKYLLLLIFPHPLSSDYSYNTIPIVKSIANIGFLFSLLIHSGMLVYAIRKIKEKHILSYCIFFYFISMALASNIFIMIGTHLAERLLFFPSIAFSIAASYGLTKLFKAKAQEADSKFSFVFNTNKSMFLVLGIVLFLFSIKTIARNKDWKTDSLLIAQDIKTVPNSAHMLFYYANNLTNKDSLKAASPTERDRRLNLARTSIDKAIAMYDAFPDAHNVSGRIWYEVKNYDMAYKSYGHAMAMNPGKAIYHNNVGTCLFAKGNYEGARMEFQKAAELDKYYADAQCNLGSAYGAIGEAYRNRNLPDSANMMFGKAIEMFKKATESDPNYKSAYQFLGMTYRNMGDSVNENKYYDIANRIRQ